MNANNPRLDAAIEKLIEGYKNGGKLLVCGNGGSAADSGHIVGELVKGFLKKRPLPAEWESLDYADHTLVEEMLARLLQLLICTISPAHIDLHADFWNDRLISRLNFNLSTKLRCIDSPPRLHFKTITAEKLAPQLRIAMAGAENARH